MKNICNKFITGKIGILLALGWMSISTSSCTYYYTPNGTSSFSGATTYCQGTAVTPDTLTYTQCATSGSLPSGVSCTAQWYYNTTGGTVIGTSTPLGSPIIFTTPTADSGQLTYLPLTLTSGTFYYFVDVTWGAGSYCSASYTSSTQTITINPGPGALSGSSVVCAGDTIVLSDTTAGGTWSSGASSVATVATDGTVTGISPGISVISYTTSGCAPATMTITVSPGPGPITGPSSFCKDSTITLSDTSAGGTWSSGSAGTATVSSTGVVTGISTGTVTVSYSVAGCSATVVLTVDPAANAGTITGTDTIVCVGDTITFSNTATGGVWGATNVSLATVSGSGLVIGIAPGIDTVTYIVTNSCGAATAKHRVKVLSTAICHVGVAELSAGAKAGLTIFPNPNSGTFTMELTAPHDENVHVVITNTVGEKVKDFTTTTNRVHEIQLAPAAGIYLLTATTGNGNYNAKLVVN